MQVEKLNEFLHRMTDVEIIQKQEHTNINELHLPYQTVKIPKIPGDSFFGEGNIFINRQQRFSKTPAHTHEFVELNDKGVHSRDFSHE